MAQMLQKTIEGMQQHEQPNILIGSIFLMESMIQVLDVHSFEATFPTMARALRGLADTQVAKLKADM